MEDPTALNRLPSTELGQHLSSNGRAGVVGELPHALQKKYTASSLCEWALPQDARDIGSLCGSRLALGSDITWRRAAY